MKKVIFFLIFVAIASGFTGFGIGTSKPDAPAKTSAAVERPLIEYINEVRAANNVPALKEDAGLDSTAKLKAEDMAAQNYMSHTTPGGEPFYVLIQKNRPGLNHVGENLAECFKTTPETMAAWIASPGHMQNIVNSRFTMFGSYTVFDQDRNCLLSVNHFGKE